MTKSIDHAGLVTEGVRWLRQLGARVVIPELKAATQAGEIPDVIGWKSGYSILLECKMSRADFLADKKKYFREHPEKGMGNYRLYLCPEGLISPEELPKNWGLLYYQKGSSDLKRSVCFKGNIICVGPQLKLQPCNHRDEVALLVSFISRNKK